MIPNCQHSEDISKIAQALVKALPNIHAATKDSKNPHFNSKYADLSAVMDTCKAPLAEQSIVVLQPPASNAGEGVVTVSTVLLHESGQWIGCDLSLKPVKSDPQGMGSAITYARRYSLQSMLGIPAEDDDGNAASGSGSHQAAQNVAQRRIADLSKNKPQPVATAKPSGAVTEDLLKSYLRRAGSGPAGARAVYAELAEELRKLGGNDLADQCWNQAIADVADQNAEFNVIVTRLYRSLKSAQEPAA